MRDEKLQRNNIAPGAGGMDPFMGPRDPQSSGGRGRIDHIAAQEHVANQI